MSIRQGRRSQSYAGGAIVALDWFALAFWTETLAIGGAAIALRRTEIVNSAYHLFLATRGTLCAWQTSRSQLKSAVIRAACTHQQPVAIQWSKGLSGRAL